MPPAKSQVTKDRYIRASNFQAKSLMLSVLSAKIKWKARSRTQRTGLILKGKRVIEGFEPSTSWSRTSGQNHISRCPGVTYWFSGRSRMDKSGQVIA